MYVDGWACVATWNMNQSLRTSWPVLAAAFFPVLSTFGQGVFQNLNFESALVDPAQPPGVVSVADALPGWTVYAGSNQVTSVNYNFVQYGGTVVDLLGRSNHV